MSVSLREFATRVTRAAALWVVALAALLLMTGAWALDKPEGGLLVLGGTGALGSEIVRDLVEAGHSVTVLVRPTSNRARIEDLKISYVVGDILNEADVERLFAAGPYRVVVDALARDSIQDRTFYHESQRLISSYAASTGVSQVILHGSVGAGDSRELMVGVAVLERHWALLDSKTQAENILKDSGVGYTIIRNSELLPLQYRESGAARLTTDHSIKGFVTRDGLARLTLECVDNPRCMNQTFHALDDELDIPGITD